MNAMIPDPPTYAEERRSRRKHRTSSGEEDDVAPYDSGVPKEEEQRHTNNDDLDDEDDAVSALSGGGDTALSASSKRSVWSNAALILRGINPDTIPEEEERGEDSLVGRSILSAASSNSMRPSRSSTEMYKNDGVLVEDGNDDFSRLKNNKQNRINRYREERNNAVASPPRTNSSNRNGEWMLSPQSSRNSNNSFGQGVVAELDFLKDDPSTMTYGRRIALYLMQRYAWYNPQLVSMKRESKSSEQDEEEESEEFPLHPMLIAAMQKKNRGVGMAQLAEALSSDTGDDNDGDGLLMTTCSRSSHRTTNNMSERVLLESYPFTHSRREKPRLDKAWAYFDHVALSRYVVLASNTNNNKPKKCIATRVYRKLFCKRLKQLKRAEPGEREVPTALYEPIFTPHGQLGDFGLGLGLYFSALRAITILTLGAGLLNLPNFYYYSSTDYTPGLSNFNSTSLTTVSNVLQGSAICTDVSWVVCVDCANLSENEQKRYFHSNRRAYGQPKIGAEGNGSDASGNNASFAANQNNTNMFYLRNNCPSPSIQTSMINYATLLWIMIGTVALNIYSRRMEVAYDEDEQTAQDYSIIISNPPGDATDPTEWHDFFKEAFDGAHVTACTVAVDNDLLVRSLVERRELLRKIEMLLEPGTALDTLTLAGVAAKQERERRLVRKLLAIVAHGIPEHFARLTVLTAKVQGLAQQDYPATNIFVTFETELAQRQVLSAYNIGSLAVKRNTTSAVQPKHLFRGTHVLKIGEPDEPNTVRWQDLNIKSSEKFKQQFYTTLATLAAIFSIAFLVRAVNDQSVTYTAFTIAIFNAIFPMFAKMLTNLEAHSSEGNKQCSLFLKIALFRWVNTAVVITIVTPFTATLTNGALVDQIYALFRAEIITSNAILLLDPMGHINRHILAPRGSTQDAMNLKMQGAVFELAERYTNMTKLLFLAVWYCSVFPGALLMCSLALFINYFADRFALMRIWKRPPQLGTKISEFSRRYFFSLAIVAMAVLASYYWAGFPFDNLCLVDESGSDRPADANDWFVGEWIITPVTQFGLWNEESTNITISVPANADLYRHCLQDFFRYPWAEKKFPFVSLFQLEGQEWMTVDQEVVTDIFGWTAVGVIAIVLWAFVYTWYGSFIKLFRGTYDACGDDQEINFSDVPSINSYVPEVKSDVFSYPLLACNIDRIDKGLLEWTDPDRPHVFYDLTKDAEVLLRGTDVSSKIVFTQISHWPPPASKKTNNSKIK